MDYSLVCTSCRRSYGDDCSLARCSKCGGVLEVSYDYSTLKLGKGFWGGRISHRKYTPFYPVTRKLVSMGEGGTRLVSADGIANRAGSGTDLRIKVETSNPTRTFKDRGSTVEITKALELGFGSVCCASTGNMGLSVATYAAHEGLECTVFISRSANREKVDKIRRSGAKVAAISGDFNQAMEACEAYAARSGSFVCGDYHYRKEGQKSVAFEIIEQMRKGEPDAVVVQVGNATLLAAMYKGLKELRAARIIRKLPRLIAVQSNRCNPLVRAYSSGGKVRYMKPKTIADAIAVGYPTFGFEGLAAIRGTRGFAVSVSDKEISVAMEMLRHEEGVSAEPGGATGMAGFLKVHRLRPKELDGKRVVVVVTGNNEE